jgi:hypothetical protein
VLLLSKQRLILAFSSPVGPRALTLMALNASSPSAVRRHARSSGVALSKAPPWETSTPSVTPDVVVVAPAVVVTPDVVVVAPAVVVTPDVVVVAPAVVVTPDVVVMAPAVVVTPDVVVMAPAVTSGPAVSGPPLHAAINTRTTTTVWTCLIL